MNLVGVGSLYILYTSQTAPSKWTTQKGAVMEEACSTREQRQTHVTLSNIN